MSRSWIKQAELSNGWAMKLLLWVSLRLGRRIARLTLPPITVYYLLRAGEARRASRSYLNRVLGRPAHLIDVARHIHCFASTILDRVFLLSGQDSRLEIRVHGEELLQHQVDRGEGCLLLGAHLGSFEILRAIGVSQHALPIRVLMYSEHNQTLTRLLNELNPDIAHTIIPLGGIDSLLQVQQSLAEGHLVGLLGDRIAENDKVLSCHFLGGQALFPKGPLLMATALKAPILLCFGLYQGGNRYDIHFETLCQAPVIPRDRRNQVAMELTSRYAERLEYYARKAPYNWFNFYDYWQA